MRGETLIKYLSLYFLVLAMHMQFKKPFNTSFIKIKQILNYQCYTFAVC